MVKGGTEAAKFFSEGPKMVQNLGKFSFSMMPRHEAHQTDQQNALNTKMYVLGAKNIFFFQGSKVVKKLAKIGWPNFFIVISSFGGWGDL